jgi:hypothetical protein
MIFETRAWGTEIWSWKIFSNHVVPSIHPCLDIEENVLASLRISLVTKFAVRNVLIKNCLFACHLLLIDTFTGNKYNIGNITHHMIQGVSVSYAPFQYYYNYVILTRLT